MKKICIVGAGRVGETTAQILAEEELCREIALFDVREDVPQGVALDIDQTAPFFEFDCAISGSNDPQILRDSELVAVTAGLPVPVAFRAAVDPAAPDGAAITNTAAIRDGLGRLYDRTAVAKASIPPTIVYTYPADDQIGVPITAPLVITFSEPIDVASWVLAITPDPGLEPSVWSPDLTAVTVHHLPFAYDQRYTVTVAAADLDGRALVPGFVPNPWSFTTETRPLYRTYLPLVLK